MLFPPLHNKKFGYVNLNLEAQKWLAEHELSSKSKNPLLDPLTCQKMVAAVHRKLHLDFSYGGWMEDRSSLWKGSYLDQWKTYTHLGIDINVPAGTSVAASFDAEVIKIDDDYPEEGGWGPRVILKHATERVYMIHAHLYPKISCKVGDKLKAGQAFAKVGKPPHNGNWFPHLHLQVISQKYFNQLEKGNLWHELDGYGLAEEVKKNSERFPDPLQYISL